MNQKSMTILFYLNKAKTNQKGVCPLYCRITFLKKRKQFSTGEFINPKDWNSKKQKATTKEINLQLELIAVNLIKAYLQLQIGKDEFTVEDIFNNYIGKPSTEEIGVIAYFKKFLAKKKELVGIDIEFATWKKFNIVYSQTQDFVKLKYGKKDLALNKLKFQFLKDFEYYLKTERKQKQVSVNKTLQRLRKPIREAVDEGSLESDPFASHQPGRVLKEVIFLSADELKKLENNHFHQPRLQLVKNLFVFCCYTGLAYNEMSNLKKENIVKGFDGNLWIQMKRKKTGKTISVPLLPKAKEILEKYRSEENPYLLPKFSNQKINSYLKEIADIVGFNKRITHHTARKTFASTVLLYNDVPIEVVSELLGHSDIKITQEYYGKIVQKRISQEMKRISDKLK